MSRFDHTKYDDCAQKNSDFFKEKFDEIEPVLNFIESTREKAIALTRLEECLMWIRKAIREDQRHREMKNKFVHTRNG